MFSKGTPTHLAPSEQTHPALDRSTVDHVFIPKREPRAAIEPRREWSDDVCECLFITRTKSASRVRETHFSFVSQWTVQTSSNSAGSLPAAGPCGSGLCLASNAHELPALSSARGKHCFNTQKPFSQGQAKSRKLSPLTAFSRSTACAGGSFWTGIAGMKTMRTRHAVITGSLAEAMHRTSCTSSVAVFVWYIFKARPT